MYINIELFRGHKFAPKIDFGPIVKVCPDGYKKRLFEFQVCPQFVTLSGEGWMIYPAVFFRPGKRITQKGDHVSARMIRGHLSIMWLDCSLSLLYSINKISIL